MLKNITIVSQYFAPAWSYGGPPKVLYILAKELVKRGKEVRIITTDALDEKRNDVLKEKLEGIEIYRFKTISNFLAYRIKVFIVPGIVGEVTDILDKSDVILFSEVRSIINWQIYPYVLRKRIPYGIFPLGTIPYGTGFKAIIKKILDKLWVDYFVQKASFRFAQTEQEQYMFSKFFNISASETQLLPLPVEESQYRPDKKTLSEFKKRWKISNDDKVLLFVGRLNYLKGVDILIKAVKPLLEGDKNLKLLIVGRDDGAKADLKALVSHGLNNQIIFSGPLYQKEAFYAYLSADLFVMTPRFYEETALAAIEALSYGVPVITTKEADIPFLEEYGAGFVIKNTSDTIQKTIHTLLEKTRINSKMIRIKARKLINDHYRSEIVAQQLLDYLE